MNVKVRNEGLLGIYLCLMGVEGATFLSNQGNIWLLQNLLWYFRTHTSAVVRLISSSLLGFSAYNNTKEPVVGEHPIDEFHLRASLLLRR